MSRCGACRRAYTRGVSGDVQREQQRDRSRAVRRRAAAVIAAVALIAGGAAAVAALSFAGLRGTVADGVLRVRNEGKPAPAEILVVEVDEAIVNRYGLPLPRSRYGSAIRRLDRAGAKVVAVDVQFTEASSEREDNELVWAIEETEVPVVLATSQVVGGERQTDVLGGRPLLSEIGAEAAHSALPLAADGRWRRTVRAVDGLDSFAQVTARLAGEPQVPVGGALLDPTIPASRLTRVTLSELLAGRVPRREIAGKIVVIGLTLVTESGDDRGLVAGSTGPQFGVFVHAQAIDTTLRGSPLRSGTGLSWLLTLAAVALTSLTMLLRRPWLHLASLLAGTVALVIAAVLTARAGVLSDPLPAAFALLAGGVAGIGARAAIERNRRAHARRSLARFVPPGVVDDLLAEGSDGRLPPKLQQATVLFSDLRGYTSLVAHLPRPEALADVLDAYLGEVTAVIHAHGGTVVSFQGDGVMSAFGAPIASEDAPKRAVAAASALLNEALPRVAARMAELVPSAPAPALGVGIATGDVLAGTVGPPERREYAVVGSPTNLAARLQAQSKLERTPIVIDGATARAAGADSASHTGVRVGDAELRLLGEREIRGLEQPVECWTLAGPATDA